MFAPPSFSGFGAFMPFMLPPVVFLPFLPLMAMPVIIIIVGSCRKNYKGRS
jgi:hypothetical protein